MTLDVQLYFFKFRPHISHIKRSFAHKQKLIVAFEESRKPHVGARNQRAGLTIIGGSGIIKAHIINVREISRCTVPPFYAWPSPQGEGFYFRSSVL